MDEASEDATAAESGEALSVLCALLADALMEIKNTEGRCIMVEYATI